ncbi:MAG: endopeptidase La, partial [Lentisphaeria bacterium]|nr:endopeptidase La [Lentisphaeria bacterium]
HFSEDRLDISEARKILDRDHYGLKDIKERILEFLSVLQLKKDRKAPIICFIGPPGVGKTSLGKSIAEAMGRKFVRISLGGVRDEAEIRGHRRTYVGALPGRIIQGMKKAGTSNPVFMLDEIDKLGNDFRGDPASALLEVLDPQQNHAFNDHYLEVDYDLSSVMFIATANISDTIPAPLLDRMDVIRLPGYTATEKKQIAEQFLIPRQLEENGFAGRNVTFTGDAVDELIGYYTREAGVRQLERTIGQICRKLARQIVEGRNKKKKIVIDSKTVRELLGARKFLMDEAMAQPEIGVATGMAWTSVGGTILQVEAVMMPGKGELKLTGSLGNVMKESAMAAFSYVKGHARELGINSRLFEKNDFHIHVPDGATPKDGPSAGITLTTALVSLLTGKPVRHDFAMTGEINLRGKVTAIGGVKEKSIGALRAGIRNIILPEENRKDLEEIPEDVARQVNFHFVSEIGQVLKIMLAKPVAGKRSMVRKGSKK